MSQWHSGGNAFFFKLGCNFGWYLDYVPNRDVPNLNLWH